MELPDFGVVKESAYCEKTIVPKPKKRNVGARKVVRASSYNREATCESCGDSSGCVSPSRANKWKADHITRNLGHVVDVDTCASAKKNTKGKQPLVG